MAALLISWVFAGWLSLIFGLSGTNLLTSYLREDKQALRDSRVDYILLFGFILVTSLTSIITLFSPINWLVTSGFTVVGIYLSYIHKKELLQVFSNIVSGAKAMSLPLKVAVAAAFLLSMCAIIIEFGESDVWFYHSQSIKWIKEYAVVPGLGNLHGRFAFNSHFFVSSSVFTLWFSEEYVVFSLNSLFFFLFTVRLLLNIQQSLTREQWPFFILNSLLLVTCTFQIFPLTNGTSTDAISAILLLYAFLLFLEYTFNEKTTTELVLFWSLILTASTFKLSAIFSGFLLLYHLPIVFKKRRFPVFLAVSLFIMLPFITRNIILSGYLVYPVPSLDVLSVDWKIPMEEVVLEKELIEGWQKLPNGEGANIPIEEIPQILDVPFVEWIKEWWPSKSLKWKSVMIIDLFTVLLMFIALYRKNYKLALLCFTVFFNLVFWFLKTPNPRFAYAFLLIGLSLVFAYSLSPILEKKYVRFNQYLFILFSVLMLSSPVLKSDVIYVDNPDLSLLLIPQYYQIQSPPETFETKDFTVNTPPSAPPAKGIWCYNLPLPCTPFPKKNLVMRGEDYQAGFRVDKSQPSTWNTNKMKK